MNDTYGQSSQQFSVIQMGNETNYSWAIFTSSQVYSSIAPGVDRLYPQLSYMFMMDPFYPGASQVYLHELGQKGTGIN